MQVGATLGRRFTLVRAEEYDLPGVERFVANDARLNKEVTVDIVTAVSPTAVKRAAAKASLVRDPRIVRIVATGRDQYEDRDVTYVVSERPGGTRLNEVLAARALPPQVAGAIAGDVARALKVAAAQGLHHGHVRGAALTVTRRGRVMIEGLELDHELATQAHLDQQRGSRERVDAVGIARVYLGAITGKDASDVSVEDLPDALSPQAEALCRAVIHGSGPRSLDEVVTAVTPFTSTVLAGFAGNVAQLPWRPDIIAERAAQLEHRIDEINAAITIDEATLAAASQLVRQHESEHTSSTGAIPPLGFDDAAIDVDDYVPYTDGDITDLHTFEVMAAEQNAEVEPSVWEDLLEGLHTRWPRSELLTTRLAKAHERSQRTAPINATPLMMAIGVVALLIAAIVSFSLLGKPFEPDFRRYNPPANTYPAFTFTPSPTPSADEEAE